MARPKFMSPAASGYPDSGCRPAPGARRGGNAAFPRTCASSHCHAG